jgi:hypothetical protein
MLVGKDLPELGTWGSDQYKTANERAVDAPIWLPHCKLEVVRKLRRVE